MYHEIFPYKTSHLTTAALQTCLNHYKVLQLLICFNGKEFLSQEFTDLLDQYNIKLKTTHPYSPEENGKCERIWRTLDTVSRGNHNAKIIQDIINQCNSSWPQ